MTAAELRARLTEIAAEAPSAEHGDDAVAPMTCTGRDVITTAACDKPLKPAAVLVPVVLSNAPGILLTKRTSHLAQHAGQISFPGGRIDPEDSGPEAAALREAWEEIGLRARSVEILGRMRNYVTGTGYRITPVLALLPPNLVFSPFAARSGGGVRIAARGRARSRRAAAAASACSGVMARVLGLATSGTLHLGCHRGDPGGFGGAPAGRPEPRKDCLMRLWLSVAVFFAVSLDGSLPGVPSLSQVASAQTRIDAISTTFRWLGPNDKIVVERYDDPRVQNVSCYLSRAETGGVKGGLGLAEDPSRFSVACRAVGPVAWPDSIPKSEVIGFYSASLFFKTFQIHRALDTEKRVLVYTVISTKLINGSPFNSISVVPTAVP